MQETVMCIRRAIRAETDHSSGCTSYARCGLNEEAGECEDDLFAEFLS